MTGLPLSGKVTLRVDTELRKEVLAWLRNQGLDADTVRAAVLHDRHNTDDHGEALPLPCMHGSMSSAPYDPAIIFHGSWNCMHACS